MILYDQNYNFIGMSSETLSYLGYEDLEDFTSQHSDFANLLVNKEGYIYKFQNFSWIDFILYSGSPNKSALLKLKSGEAMEIKLSVKEVYLTADINGNRKYFSIRILSDNFVNIASKTDASFAKEAAVASNSFNLNNLMSDDSPQEPQSTPAPVQEETTSDFVLNFPSEEEINGTDGGIKLDLSMPDESDNAITIPHEEDNSSDEIFKLNLSDDSFMEEETPTEEVSINKVEVAAIQEDEIALDFLKTKSVEEPKDEILPQTTEVPVSQEEESLPVEQEVQPSLKLDFLKVTDDVEEDERIGSGFKLKHRREPEETLQQENMEQPLDFLKKSKPTAQEQEDVSLNLLQQTHQEHSPLEELKETSPVLDFFKKDTEEPDAMQNMENKEQIIAQIKHDIEEIDEVTTPVLQHETKEEEPTAENVVLDEYLFNKNEVKKEKKSFTKTLKSLFEDKTNTLEAHEEFNVETSFEMPEATLKNTSNFHVEEEKHENNHRFSTLASLGLDKEEEDDLIAEFVNDSKDNIALFKEFCNSGNINQSEYLLIKMQSSADILNLNDIINTLTEIRQACSKELDQSTLTSHIDALEQQVNQLELHLEGEAV